MRFKKLLLITVAAAMLGVASLAVVAGAVDQPISGDHTTAAEGSEQAVACREVEFEYRQVAGDIESMKIHFLSDQCITFTHKAYVEIHKANHDALANSNGTQASPGAAPAPKFTPALPFVNIDLINGAAPNGGVAMEDVGAIDHAHIVITDL